ncbi:dihydromonapterin reductase [Salmonella enterica subsp. enterica serovar Choleraesuis]|nr:dihydromonapterin reductase [Salmonella enterica subsp. enterica serovar Choleraesuis]
MMPARQTIVITGAGRRIGLALARHFLDREMAVIISYRQRTAAIEQLEAAGVTCIYADFSSDSGILTFAQALEQRGQNLRAIIHNASAWLPESPETPAAETLQAMLQIHVHAPYLLNLALEPLLRGQGAAGADIIHITDYVVERGSSKHIAYAASKAALDNLTRSFASRMAPEVKVNAIAPSLIMFNEDDDEAYRIRALNKSLMKLVPGEQEIVNAVEYILSSRYMTGRTLALDGGRNLT